MRLKCSHILMNSVYITDKYKGWAGAGGGRFTVRGQARDCKGTLLVAVGAHCLQSRAVRGLLFYCTNTVRTTVRNSFNFMPEWLLRSLLYPSSVRTSRKVTVGMN